MRRATLAVKALMAAALAGFYLFPFIWLFSSSLKSREEIFNYPPQLIPPHPTLQNFVDIFTKAPFARFLGNSLFVAGTITLAALVFHSLAAYALARLTFPGRDLLFVALIATMMVPFSVRMVPMFIITRWLGWVDTYAGLIIPPLFHAYGIFFLRQYYITIPRDLEDAARVDGCSRLRVWYHIFLPLSRPLLVILGVIFFITNYNDFIWPLIITNSESLRVIQLGLVYFSAARGSYWNLILAGATVAAVPTMIIFFTMQRHLVQGIKMAGLKG